MNLTIFIALFLILAPLNVAAGVILDSSTQKVDARVRFANRNQGGGITTQTTGGLFDGYRDGTFLSFDYVEAAQESELALGDNELIVTGTGFGRTSRAASAGATETYIGKSSIVVDFTPDMALRLDYDVSLFDAGNGHDAFFQISGLDGLILDLFGTTDATGTLILLAGETYSINIEAGGQRTTNSRHDLTSTFAIDVRVGNTPEPMTFSLLGLGALAMGATRRRRSSFRQTSK